MKKMMIILGIAIGSILLAGLGFMYLKGISPIAAGLHKPVFQVNRMALDGYDPISYFNGNIQKGKTTFTHQHAGGTWRFNSLENLNLFQQNPEKYIPQFGGYCTKAVSTGFVAPADPQVYTVFEDQLYIFSSEKERENFLAAPKEMINACQRKWD